jgi:hypothetical protein
MVKNHFYLALDKGGGSGSRSGPNLHCEVTFGVTTRAKRAVYEMVKSIPHRAAENKHGRAQVA